MYKIGEFSKIVDIPVRTLRYYDEYGILKPSEVDNFTGYRYYSDENILECHLIKLLKSLDFTLEEISKYKNCLNEEIVNKKKRELEEKMYLLKLKYRQLLLIEEEIKNNNSLINNEKILKRSSYEKRNRK